MVCAVWRMARSTVYARRSWDSRLANVALGGPQTNDRGVGQHPSTPVAQRKRGPRTPLDDAQLLAEIRTVLTASPFCTEGHRKVWARLRPRGIRVGKQRVLRLMRTANLLAPTRWRHVHGDRAHAGAIITTTPDELWGTDATKFYTRREGCARTPKFAQLVNRQIRAPGVSDSECRAPPFWGCRPPSGVAIVAQRGAGAIGP
jgi:hypothetical protein